MSLAAFCDYWLVSVPLAGVVWGCIALREVRSRRSELTGVGLAWVGLLLSTVMIAAGPAAVYYQEVSPVPAGYAMIGYDEFQPNKNVAGELVPKSAFALDGKKVYIKGYVFAGSQNSGITQIPAGARCRHVLLRRQPQSDRSDRGFAGQPDRNDVHEAGRAGGWRVPCLSQRGPQRGRRGVLSFGQCGIAMNNANTGLNVEQRLPAAAVIESPS